MKLFIVTLLKKKILVGRHRAMIGSIKYPLRQMFSLISKRFGLKVITSKELLSDCEKYHTLQFSSEESIVVTEPYNSSESEDSSRFTSKVGTITLKKPFVSKVVNAELVGPAAVGFDKDGNVISETVTPSLQELKIGLPTRTLITRNLPSFGVVELGDACSLVNCWSRNYYHWIIDGLTRIEAVEYYQEQTGRKPILIIDSNPPAWKIESLKLLGYDLDDCLQWNMSRVKVKRLVVPSFRRERNLIPPTVYRWFQHRVFSNLHALESKELSFSSRIYISRPKAAGRQVINEDEVMRALTPFGFVAYTLENMSFSDQVRLFSQAEIVVAPHGAGLTNIIFAQDLIVIELFGSLVVPVYFMLAKALSFHYGYLVADHKEKNQYNEKFDGINVDVAKLQTLVAEMLRIGGARRTPLLYSAK